MLGSFLYCFIYVFFFILLNEINVIFFLKISKKLYILQLMYELYSTVITFLKFKFILQI